METTGFSPQHGARIFCWAYCTNKGEYGFMAKTPKSLAWVRKLFADPTKTIVFHNAKFDLKMFTFEGVDVFNAKAEIDCTLILAKLYNSQLWSYELKSLGLYYLNRNTDDKDEIVEWLKANKKRFLAEHGREPNFSDAPWDVVGRRAIWDVKTTVMLHHFLKSKVVEACEELYHTERDLMFVVVDVENSGVNVDITHTKRLRAVANKNIEVLRDWLNRLICPMVVLRKKKQTFKEVGLTSFNPNSTAIEMPAAFQKLGIELIYKTKPKKGKKGKAPSQGGKWCFDEYAMMRYASGKMARVLKDSGEEGWSFDKWKAEVSANAANGDKDIFIAYVMKLRELEKMVGTYYDRIINDAVDVYREPNGREVGTLYCTFNQIEAATGRFSSSSPNLQNMPRILGPRECIIPRLGRKNYHFDYEQVEMKLFVHFAEDEDMAEAIAGDIHLFVAAEIYHLPINRVTKEQRKRAKGVNFGILYGSGAATMAETLTMKGLPTTQAEASILVNSYHRRFPSVRRTTQKFKTELMRQGYVANPFGRRYHIPSKVGYKALNYMCQGTSADLMKRAMVAVWKWLRKMGLKSRILLTVHDELAIEIPQCEEHIVIPKVRELMEDRKRFYIPITVDCEVVKRRWSEKESYKWN